MSPFTVNMTQTHRYLLQSVVVHSGDAQFGHYYVYSRPQPVQQPELWVRFDDAYVQQVPWSLVQQEAEGMLQQQTKRLFQTRQQSSTTAYLLQYTRVRDPEAATG